MGCDIHLFREVKLDNGWSTLEPPNARGADDYMHLVDTHVGRNYQLFGLLAGVRAHIPDYFLPRGLPDDVSKPVRGFAEYWGEDAHTHSWLGLKELLKKHTEFLLVDDPSDIYARQALMELLNNLQWPDDCDPEDCRIVFWFDN